MIKKNSNKETLADKIAGILSTTPASFDPEDENVDETRAKLIAEEDEDSEEVNEEELLSRFRTQNVDLLGDIDERYAGKKGSRKSLQEADDEDLSDSDRYSGQDDDEIVDSNKEENESDQDMNQDSSEQSKESEDERDSDSEVEMDFGDDSITNSKDNFKHMKETDFSSQVKKGWCVRNQMSMWENLLEMRIQVQKCLITANKMPQKESFHELKRESGAEFSEKVAEAKHNISTVLDKLLLLQKLVLNKYPETKNLDKSKENSVVNGSGDEEIPSDTEEEKSDEEVQEVEEVPKKIRKLADFEKEISESHKKYKTYRNSVIQKWNEKTRLAITKNNTNPHTIINHIEHTLLDKARLTKRTQLKRSDYKILGQKLSEENKNGDSGDIQPAQEYNSEIFDDDDFYHQLLRELIEVKSADLTDPVQLGRQWIQLQNLRSKMKRKIDTKATKGRKIRYAVHTKLVNFMAPIDGNSWTDEARTELYNSLFGKNQRYQLV